MSIPNTYAPRPLVGRDFRLCGMDYCILLRKGTCLRLSGMGMCFAMVVPFLTSFLLSLLLSLFSLCPINLFKKTIAGR